MAMLGGDCEHPLVDPYAVAAASNGAVSPDDPRLPVLIEGALAAVRAYCGWHVSPVKAETLVLDSECGRSLRLPSGRVLGVSELRIDGVPVPVGEWDWSEAGMIRLRHRRFPDRFRAVSVTLTHGLDDAPGLAAVVTRSVLGACASPMGATSESAGQMSVRWGRSGMALTVEDRAELAPYKLQQWA